MKLFYTIIIICAISLSAYSQYNPGAKQISLSNSDVALSNDVFSLFNNPSGLSQMNWREIGVYYSPAPFGLSELANGYVAYHEPTDIGSFAIGGMSYGFDLYRESKFALGYSYNFQNKFFVGLAINYQTVSIQNYGNDGALFFNLGGLAYITNLFRIGFSVQNINRATFGNEDDQIPMILNTGLSYDVVDELTLNFALEKDIKYKTSFQFGVNYDIIENISLRSGFSNEPSKYSVGIGINYLMFSLDYALFTHNDLGLTHQAGVIVSFGRDVSRSKSIRKYLGLE
ncbi:MAG: type IX secretion system membrane protein PorP/SprF [Ignavibacteriaceae bacterium]